MLFLSCASTRKDYDYWDSLNEDKVSKNHISLYRRVGDHVGVNVIRCFILFKKPSSTFEIYFEDGEGIIGRYVTRNDTLEMYHDYSVWQSRNDSIKIKKLVCNDTVGGFFPDKFIIKNDSLLDITNYSYPELISNMVSNVKNDFVLVK